MLKKHQELLAEIEAATTSTMKLMTEGCELRHAYRLLKQASDRVQRRIVAYEAEAAAKKITSPKPAAG